MQMALQKHELIVPAQHKDCLCIIVWLTVLRVPHGSILLGCKIIRTSVSLRFFVDITCKARLMKPFKLYSREQGCYTIVVLLTVATYKACQTSGQVATKIFVTDPSRLNWSAERFTVYLGCVFVSQGMLLPVN